MVVMAILLGMRRLHISIYLKHQGQKQGNTRPQFGQGHMSSVSMPERLKIEFVINFLKFCCCFSYTHKTKEMLMNFNLFQVSKNVIFCNETSIILNSIYRVFDHPWRQSMDDVFFFFFFKKKKKSEVRKYLMGMNFWSHYYHNFHTFQ